MVIQILVRQLEQKFNLMKSIIILKSLSDIVNKYDTFIIDLWGVIHDGKKTYEHATDCINKLHKLNKKIILISNSSKSNLITINKLKKLGLNIQMFTKIITSGEVVFEELRSPTFEWSKNLGNKYYHLSNLLEKNKYKSFKEFDKKLVDNISSADFIIASSANPEISVLEYVPFLKKACERQLPFICLNPDYESVERNKYNQKSICMGSVGKLYEDFGGKVHILGKPSKYIYEKATESIDNFKKSRTLAIGDSISHDIAGAFNFGVKNVLITSGIHSDVLKNKNLDLDKEIDKLSDFNIRPDYICDRLVF